MKYLKLVPSTLLGVLFVFAAVTFLFKMVPMPPQTGDVAVFNDLFGKSGYMTTIKLLELVVGVMLLIPKTRALALVLIMPICINILLFELHIAHAPGIGLVLVLLACIGLYLHKEKYSGILR
jgi:putative oxidoreductase